jgi:hypothetical protein
MKQRSDPAVACRLSAPALQRRIAWIRDHLLTRAVARRPRAGALELTLPTDAELRARVSEWIELEGECCPFLEFHVRDAGADHFAVAVAGPPGSDAIFDAWLQR